MESSFSADQRPKLLFDRLSEVNDAVGDIAVNNEVDVGAESTIESCTAKLGGCYLGLYRRAP